jgi:hypothetical protein
MVETACADCRGGVRLYRLLKTGECAGRVEETQRLCQENNGTSFASYAPTFALGEELLQTCKLHLAMSQIWEMTRLW